ncbi:Predicted PurR-regulated permease PerM [Neorhodopirellula lusitana]|uniref:Predicted PurR-regulated permease PerM n=1 Tax=Neorhodopirellula lusitana TaxID=445327 RepID=A0ABY1Q4C1_9BACT|nr:AI-2E family transporter [Neorhodopirellula lusitana]SMP59253.1 Predicted PurR-regulated permease PerM [Neorhodopirellula lusitana]
MSTAAKTPSGLAEDSSGLAPVLIFSADDSSTATIEVYSVATRVCAVLLVLYAMYFARSLFVPIVTSMFAYLTLRPIVRQTRKFGVPPSVSAAAVMALLGGLLALATYLVIDPARDVIAEAPANIAIAKERLSFVIEKIEYFNRATDEMTTTDTDGVKEVNEPVPVEVKLAAWSTNLSILNGTGNLVSFLGVSGVLLYFLLATGDDLLRNVMRALPTLTARKQLIGVVENVQEGLGSYLAQVTAINIGLGVAVGLAMWGLEMPTPVLWGVMAMLLNFIPMVGALCGALVIFLVTLVNFEASYYAFIVAGVYVTLTTIEGQFITPSILGRSLEMSPVLVFLSVVTWGWMWGMMGVFLSVPILIAARMVCEQYSGMKSLAAVLGGRVEET